jgi:hypothetical protein
MQDNNGYTALIASLQVGNYTIALLLIAADASAEHLRTQDNDGNIALCYAAAEGHSNIVRALIAADPAVDHLQLMNNDGQTAIDLAMERNRARRKAGVPRSSADDRVSECMAILREAGAEAKPEAGAEVGAEVGVEVGAGFGVETGVGMGARVEERRESGGE